MIKREEKLIKLGLARQLNQEIKSPHVTFLPDFSALCMYQINMWTAPFSLNYIYFNSLPSHKIFHLQINYHMYNEDHRRQNPKSFLARSINYISRWIETAVSFCLIIDELYDLLSLKYLFFKQRIYIEYVALVSKDVCKLGNILNVASVSKDVCRLLQISKLASN